MIALITPTGNRPLQMRLCEHWMSKQTYSGKVLWIIVDDCEPVTTDHIKTGFKKDWYVEHVHPTPKWEDGQDTQRRNLLAAIPVIRKNPSVEYIFIIEDDDYYSPDYLETMIEKLDGCSLAGEAYSIYFNVENNTIKRYKNARHASLFQTAFRKCLLDAFENCLNNSDGFIDLHFWSMIPISRQKIFALRKPLAIGIKGVAGRKGIGVGHTMTKSGNDERELKNLVADYINDFEKCRIQFS